MTLATGPIALVNSYAAYTITFAAGGNRTILMSYSGDGNVNACVGQATVPVAAQAATTTALTRSTTGPVASGTAVTLTATVATAVPGGTLAGTVNFLDGTTLIGSAPLVLPGLTASFTTTALAGGTRALTAVYVGNAQYAASTSAAVSQVVSAFTLTGTPAAIGVQTGQSTSAIVAVVPLGGFNSAVTLACGALPANMTCTITPGAVTPDGINAAPATVNLTTGTKAHADGRLPPGFWAPVGGVSLAGVLLLLPFRRRRLRGRLLLSVLSLALLGGLLGSTAGCSGSSGASGTPAVDVVPGSYAVPITATGPAGTTQTVSLTITVTL